MADFDRYPDRQATEDEFLWLEDIEGADALGWVDEQNARTIQALDAGAFTDLQGRLLEVLDSTDRIPRVTKRGDWLYNHWQDAEHPRGLWRRTTLDEYRKDDPDWDVLLDIDALGRDEGTEWVFAGASLLHPTQDRALVLLSPDGGDAFEVREFDLESRTFVDGGFRAPTAKTGVSWIDRDTVVITTDFGEGTMTLSSYPRQARRWRRGEPLAEATLIHEAPADHMGVWSHHDHTVEEGRTIIEDRIDFWTLDHLVEWKGELRRLDVPADAEVSLHREWLVIWLRSDWQVEGVTHQAGSLLVVPFEAYLAREVMPGIVFEPDARTSLASMSWTRNALLLTTLQDVSSRILVAEPGEGGWTTRELGWAQPNQSIHAGGVDADETDDYWLTDYGFAQPETLRLGGVGSDEVETLKSAPAFFDGSAHDVAQHFAISADGTRVPYFLVSPRGVALDGSTPTILYGYGGFEIPLTPTYSGLVGRGWLE